MRLEHGTEVRREALGTAFVDSYVKLRMAEWNDYARHLTQCPDCRRQFPDR